MVPKQALVKSVSQTHTCTIPQVMVVAYGYVLRMVIWCLSLYGAYGTFIDPNIAIKRGCK